MASNDHAGPARLSLRRGVHGALDDVVVRDVEMFRAEMLDEDRLWLCCYLPGTAIDGDRITFEVVARGGKIEFEVGESPEGAVPLEENG